MAGIFGYFTLSKHYLAKDRLADMTRLMKLQGYGIGEVIYDDACLLGKTDFQSAGVEQPPREGAQINIAVSGEIYNGDIEKSILTWYREGRLDQLKTLNGSFAAAIYDKTTGKLTLVNDRCGLIRVFYYRDGDRFCFAPKIKPLLKLGADKSLGEGAIADFFLFGYFLGDKTFFQHIHQLPPASILEISKSGMNLTRYWDYEYAEEYDARPKEELIDELGELWQRAVERRIKKDEAIIIPLSGGLDSRAILAATLECTPKKNIVTFSFGEKGSFDFEIGKMVAKKAGVMNIPLGVEKENFEEQYDLSINDIEGMLEATPYFAINGYQGMNRYGDKLYTGYMGETIMGAHLSLDMMDKKLKLEQDYTEAKSIIFERNRLNDLEDVVRLFNPSYIAIENPKCSFESTFNEMKQISNEDMPNYCNIWDYKHRQDKCVTFSIFRFREQFKYVAPFPDNDLLYFMLKIPPHLRLNENLYKSMLLKKYPELFGLPTKTSLGLSLAPGNASLFLQRAILFSKARANRISTRLIQRNIFLNKVKNYIDYDDFLRRDSAYRDYVRGMLDKAKGRNYFNSDYVEHMWRLHMQGKKNYSRLFGLLLTFELFLERFVDE